MIFLGWLVVIGLPLVVIVGAICWPERIPLDRTGETEADEGRHRPRSSHNVGSVRVSRFDDDVARIETGWCFAIVADYYVEDDAGPLPALEAVCSGRAAESCLPNADGEWIGVLSEAWTSTGSRWTFGTAVSAEQRVTRQFPRWNTPD